MSRARAAATLLTATIVVATLAFAPPALAVPDSPSPMPVDIGPDLRALGPSDVALNLDPLDAAYAAASAASGGTEPLEYVEGDVVTAIWYDDLSGLWLADYEVRAIGDHIEVWVMTDLSYPAGDPRNPVVVTEDQIDYLVDEFDNNIYPNNTAFFGTPDFHDGSGAAFTQWGLGSYYDPEGRVIAMISNIGDESYWDSSYPFYIAGFYWGSVFEYYLDRNVISIDAYEWANRVGPDSSPWRGEDPERWIANLYEGVFAHEFQHLIHDDVDPDEETWVDEGCADFAQYLNGYGHPEGHVSFFEQHPENSLVQWGDQGDLEILADYGLGYLWTLYLSEQYGQELLRSMVAEQANGIAGLNDALAAFGADRDFAETFHDFQVALLADSTNIDCRDESCRGGAWGRNRGRFELRSIDLHVNVDTEEAQDTEGAPPWGTDFVRIGSPRDVAAVAFDGAGLLSFPTDWTSDDGVLWSGAADLADSWAIFEATGGGDLTFDTWYQIEDFWDFGFVQVSTDGGLTWTSLANAFTTNDHDPGAIGTAVDNLPGLTGDSGGWVTMSFDLTPYAGQDILVAFRYVTDWAFTYAGWLIDNVTVNGTLVSDCSTNDGFRDISELHPIENDFTVTLLGVREHTGQNRYDLAFVHLDDLNEDGLAALREESDYFVMLVTSDAEQGVSDYAPYSYSLVLED